MLHQRALRTFRIDDMLASKPSCKSEVIGEGTVPLNLFRKNSIELISTPEKNSNSSNFLVQNNLEQKKASLFGIVKEESKEKMENEPENFKDFCLTDQNRLIRSSSIRTIEKESDHSVELINGSENQKKNKKIVHNLT